MDWPKHVGAYDTRAHWVSAQSLFAPLAGWPPDWAYQFPIRFSGREVRFADIAVGLSVVSSSSPLWEAQAQIVDYCSLGEDSPAPQWETLASLDPAGLEWSYQEGLPIFLTRARLAVPAHALVSAGRVMAGSYHPDVLDGLGYMVARLPDLEECMARCGGPGTAKCIGDCLAGRLS